MKTLSGLARTITIAGAVFLATGGVLAVAQGYGTGYRGGTGGGDTLPIVDTTAVVKGSVDATKLVRIEADGIATSTTRVITMPNQDIDLTPGTGNFAAVLGADDNYVTDAEKTVVGNTSGTNTGDEVSATLTVEGIVERSTSAENVTGTDDTVYPTVAGTKEMIDTHGAGASLPVADSTSIVTFGTAKEMRIDVGAVGDSTVRVLSMPNQNIDLTPGTGAFIGAATTNTLTNKTLDCNGTGNSCANIDLSADVTGTAPVGSGGTGATTLTDGGILLGSGTGAVTALGVAANGQIPIGDGTTDPVLATITSGTGVTITNGGGSITVAANLGTDIAVSELANGTDGELITWDAAGAPAVVAVGTATHVLTSNGVGVAPTFQAGGGEFTEDGDLNLFGGTNAGANLTSGQGLTNFFAGNEAGNDVTTGDSNVLIGNGAGDAMTIALNNIAIGVNAMGAGIVEGNNNIAIGNQAGNDLTLAQDTITIGNNAGSNITTAANNIAIGENALFGATGPTTGIDNIVIGQDSGFDLTSGTYNILLGKSAGANLTVGDNNIVVGQGALDAATTSATTNNNIAIGLNAIGTGVLDGDNNIAIGQGAGIAMTTAIDNTIVGALAATSLTTGDNNTIIGQNAEPSGATVSNEVTIGDTSVATSRIQVDWTILSDERDKANISPIIYGSLAFINALTPVTYQLDDRTWYYTEKVAIDADGVETITKTPKRRDGSKVASVVRLGLLAQDVMAAAALHGNGQFDEIVNSNNPDRLEYISGYMMFPVIKAIQELSAANDNLSAVNDNLVAIIADLEARLEAAGL